MKIEIVRLMEFDDENWIVVPQFVTSNCILQGTSISQRYCSFGVLRNVSNGPRGSKVGTQNPEELKTPLIQIVALLNHGCQI